MSPDPNSISLKVKDLEVDLPTVAELEDFVRLSRLGKFAEAKNYFLENLEMYTDIFPVVAEKADTLLEQNLYGDLVEFVSSVLEEQRELQSSFGELSHEKLQQSSREHDTDYPGDLDGVFTGNELHLLELLQLKGTIHVTGSVNHVLEQMRHAKGAFTQEIGYSGEQDIVEIPKLDDTQV
jgi:hypothetical protein